MKDKDFMKELKQRYLALMQLMVDAWMRTGEEKYLKDFDIMRKLYEDLNFYKDK